MDTTLLRELLERARITMPVKVIESEPGLDDHTEFGVFDENGEGVALGCYARHAELLTALLNNARALLDAADERDHLALALRAERMEISKRASERALEHRNRAIALCREWNGGRATPSPIEFIVAAQALEDLAADVIAPR